MAKIEIVNHSSQRDTLGHLHIFGEVENLGEKALSQVEVTATFFDETGGTLGKRKAPTIHQVVRPGDRASFDLMYDHLGDISGYELSVTNAEEGAAPALPMTVLEHQRQIERAGMLARMTVEGQLRNDNPQPVRFPKAILTVYDENDTVVGASFSYARPNQLLPGEVGVFRIILLSLQTIADYQITADGEVVVE